MKLTTKKTVEVEVEQFPCINCGYDGQLKWYQDTKYYMATFTCPNCDRSERGGCEWNEEYASCVATIWNPKNDRTKFIDAAEQALMELPKTQKRLIEKIKALKSGLFLKDL